MLNFPIGDIAALRFVTTDKYISGLIHRYVDRARRSFRLRRISAIAGRRPCAPIYCTRGDVAGRARRPGPRELQHRALHFVARDHCWFNRPMLCPSPATSCISASMPTDTTIIRHPPGNEAIYQPYDIKEPYYDSFHLCEPEDRATTCRSRNLTSASSYWQRDVYQSTDSTEALQNIFNYTQLSTASTLRISTRALDNDPTWQIAQELRLTSRGEGTCSGWAACTTRTCTRATSRRIRPRICKRRRRLSPRSAVLRLWAVIARPARASCGIPILHYPLPSAPGQPRGPHVQRQQSEHPQPESDLRRGELQVHARSQAHGGNARSTNSTSATCQSARPRHGVGKCHTRRSPAHPEAIPVFAEGKLVVRAHHGSHGVQHALQGLPPRRRQSAHPAEPRGAPINPGAINCGRHGPVTDPSAVLLRPDSIWSIEVGEKAGSTIGASRSMRTFTTSNGTTSSR